MRFASVCALLVLALVGCGPKEEAVKNSAPATAALNEAKSAWTPEMQAKYREAMKGARDEK